MHLSSPRDLPSTLPPSSPESLHFLSLIRNSSLHYQPPTHNNQNHQQPIQQYNANRQQQVNENSKLQKLWQMRMREKRARMQAHRKEKLLLQRLLDQRKGTSSDIENLKHEILDHSTNILTHHNVNQNNYKDNNNDNDNRNDKLDKFNNLTTQVTNDTNYHQQHRSRENLYELLNELRANMSIASNRNRRDSRTHHHHQQQHNSHHNSNNNHHQQQQLQHYNHHSSSSNNNHHQLQNLPSINNNNNNNLNSVNNNNNNHHHKSERKRKKGRYCSARDPRTLAFEAPTVFEAKIKSMTPDRQQNFSATFEIIYVYKQQANMKLPKQVRLQFAYRNASECDIYREEFRHRGYVRDELEQGKIYFLFVKQISLGNFTILGQPIKKLSRTAKDVEIGVSEKFGE
jgi:hypothetical protein